MASPIKLIDVRDDEHEPGDLEIVIGMHCVQLTLSQAGELRALLNEQHQADVEWRKLIDEAYEEHEERQRLEAKCWECGKPGDYYDGVCYECAAQPFGLHWQLEQQEGW